MLCVNFETSEKVNDCRSWLKFLSVFQKLFIMEDYYEEPDKMPIMVGDLNTSEVFMSKSRNLTEEDAKFQQDLETLMTIGS